MTTQKKPGICEAACPISDRFGASQKAPVSGEKTRRTLVQKLPGEETTTSWPVFGGSGASIYDFFLNYADKRYIILRNVNLRNGGC
jgi:hypothetical protein